MPGLDGYLNPHFDNYSYQPTQDMYQDILIQAIKMYGVEVYYVPRNIIDFDKIYETDDQSSYTNAIKTVVYIDSVDGFDGQKDFFSKFGLQIRDQVNLSMARKTFERTIQPITGQLRPNEGDLCFFVLNQKCFQIKFTNNKEIFYALGVLPLYRLTCELFEYSDETFNTGISAIDAIQQDSSLDVLDNATTTESGVVLTDESGTIITTEEYDSQDIDPITDSDNIDTNAIPLVANGSVTNNPFGWAS